MKPLRWIAALIAALALPAQAELRDIRYDYQRAERAQTDFTAADAAVQRVVLAQLMLAQFTSTNPSVTGVFNPASPGPIGATTPDAITGTTITATTKFLAPDGTAAAPSSAFANETNTGIYRYTSSNWAVSIVGTDRFYVGVPGAFVNGSLQLVSSGSIGWPSGQYLGAADLTLFRDAANTLAQRNGTNAQVFRVYNTYTDASNNERLETGWGTIGANTFGIVYKAVGTGAARGGYLANETNGSWTFRTNSADRWAISNTGMLQPSTDNAVDIGLVTTNRVRDLYLNGSAGGNATTGAVGEYVSATAAANAVALSTNTTATVTSASLTAGDWDCTGVINYTFAASTSFTNLVGGTSTTAATLGTQDTTFDFETPAAVPTATKVMSWVVPMNRFSLSATTTVYLVTQATFTVSTLGAGGTLRCRRMR